MPDLSARLVEAAEAEIINAPHYNEGREVDYRIAATGATAAVLRVLADDLDSKPPREMVPAQVLRGVLRQIADEIEASDG